MLLIGRIPIRSNRCCIQNGDGPILTFWINNAEYRGQISASLISNSTNGGCAETSSFEISGKTLLSSFFPVSAEISRATPSIESR